MDTNRIKKHLQAHFERGLVTVVGSGLSVAEGIPGMTALARHLCKHVPGKLTDATAAWEKIDAALRAEEGLEAVLLRHPPPAELEKVIGGLTAALISAAEIKVVQEVILGSRELKLSRLLKHLLPLNDEIPIITTNYDRLVEISAEAVGLGVDCSFVGHHLGRLNSRESRYSFCRDVQWRGRSPRFIYNKRVLVLKPHGSLDWYLRDGDPLRCPLELDLPRLLITPGLNKYRNGYDRPFDHHRERANQRIDRANGFLIIGYGFNDDHLQTHLVEKLRKGMAALILTRSLTDRAKELVTSCTKVTALTKAPEGGTLFHDSTNKHHIPDQRWWDVGAFVSEVLEP